jgi:hypothetical protein
MVDVDRGRRPNRGHNHGRPGARDQRGDDDGGDQRVLERIGVDPHRPEHA